MPGRIQPSAGGGWPHFGRPFGGHGASATDRHLGTPFGWRAVDALRFLEVGGDSVRRVSTITTLHHPGGKVPAGADEGASGAGHQGLPPLAQRSQAPLADEAPR